MAYTLKTLTADSSNYGSARSSSKIKYIVVHYTGNKTDTAKANANYFANNKNLSASAHYFVDDDYVYQSVPDLKIAYSVGGTRYSDYKTTGGASMYKTITNTNSISVEMCSTSGAISSATQTNAATLIKKLMSKYDIDSDHVYRHFDVNGKHCPGWSGWYGSSESKWTAFKKKLITSSSSSSSSTSSSSSSSSTSSTSAQSYNKSLAGTYKVTTTAGKLNMRKSPSTGTVIVQIPKGSKVTNYGYYTSVSGVKWLYVQYTKSSKTYTGFCSSKYLTKV